MNLSREQIKRMAISVEECLINVAFSEAEILKMKDEVIEISMRELKENAEWDEVKRDHKEKMMEMKKQKFENIANIKNGFHQEEEKLYLIPNYDNYTMEYYREDGTFEKKRPMMPEERQLRLHEVKSVNE